MLTQGILRIVSWVSYQLALNLIVLLFSLLFLGKLFNSISSRNHASVKETTCLLEYARIPTVVYVVQALARYPPLEEQEEHAVDEQDDRVDQPRTRAEGERAPDARRQVHLRRAQHGVVHPLRAHRDVVPRVESLDARVRPRGVVPPALHDGDRLPDGAEDVFSRSE